MNHIEVTAAELAEDRALVSTFRSHGMSDYEASMLAANIQIARRGRP